MAALVRDVPLISNGFALSMSPDRLGRLGPTDPAWPRAELWEQYHAHGYLWLKGILDRQEALAFRIGLCEGLANGILDHMMGRAMAPS